MKCVFVYDKKDYVMENNFLCFGVFFDRSHTHKNTHIKTVSKKYEILNGREESPKEKKIECVEK